MTAEGTQLLAHEAERAGAQRIRLEHRRRIEPADLVGGKGSVSETDQDFTEDRDVPVDLENIGLPLTPGLRVSVAPPNSKIRRARRAFLVLGRGRRDAGQCDRRQDRAATDTSLKGWTEHCLIIRQPICLFW